MNLLMVSNTIIALAFILLPLGIYQVYIRRTYTYHWIVAIFAVIILMVGITHLVEFIDFINPIPSIHAFVTATTALIALVGTIAFYSILPNVLRMPTVQEMQRQTQSQIEMLFHSNVIGVVFNNLDGRILDSNDAFLKIIGYTREELKNGLRWDTMTPPEYINTDVNAVSILKKNRVIPQREKEFFRKDGSRVPVLVGGILIDTKKGDTVSFCIDLSEQKKILQQKDQFLEIASHELKTPLASVKGYVQLLDRTVSETDNPNAKQLIAKTEQYVDKLNTLISDLLDMSKIQAGKLHYRREPFNLSLLTQDVVDSIQTTAHHTIHKSIQKNVIVDGDAERIEQVVTNLLTNAIKYSPQGKHIYVSLKKTIKNVILSICDEGMGIEKKHLAHVFDRYYRINEDSNALATAGMGIGLYICSQIIARHRGTISVESELGKGSTFTVTLPSIRHS